MEEEIQEEDQEEESLLVALLEESEGVDTQEANQEELIGEVEANQEEVVLEEELDLKEGVGLEEVGRDRLTPELNPNLTRKLIRVTRDYADYAGLRLYNKGFDRVLGFSKQTLYPSRPV